MKRAGILAATAVAFVLAGCSAGTPADTPTQTSAPLTAQSPTAANGDDAEAAFLAEVRANLPAKTQIPDATDEQLLDAGKEACERRAAGEVLEEISVIEGEEKSASGYYIDSLPIIQAAITTLCPR